MTSFSLSRRPLTPPQTRAGVRSGQREGKYFLTLFLLLIALCTTLQAQQTQLPLLVADFNHDGIPDVLVQTQASTGGYTPATATIAFGSVPYGTFSSNTKAVNFPSACVAFNYDAPSGQLLAGDFNGDTLPDIFFSCYTNSGGTASITGVMLGNGDGTFGAPTLLTLPSSLSPILFVLSDFNHDNKLDVAIVSYNGSQQEVLSFLAGKGDGTFAAPVSTTLGAAFNLSDEGYAPLEGLIAIDVNGDGYPDLVASSIPGGVYPGPINVVVFGNNKDGTFGTVSDGTATPNVTYTLGTAPAVVSFNVHSGNAFGSGKPDLLIADSGTAAPGLFVLQNTSTATTYSFATPVKIPATASGDLQVGNFTGTAFTDVALLNTTGVTILANDGTGNYTSAYSNLTLTASTATLTNQFAVADANNDGYSDLYTASTDSTGALHLAVNLVSGSASAVSQPVSLPTGTQPLTAVWSGNANFKGATATGSQLVNGVPTSTSLSSSLNPSTVGASVTLTAQALPVTASTQTPTGTMQLTDNGAPLASGTVDSTGTFRYTSSALTKGTHTILATYLGDTYFATSSSQPLAQVVNPAAAVTPTLTWPTPAAIPYGTPLSSTQLDAVATSPTGAPIPGTYVYTPLAGTILAAGTQTLSVLFTPTDLTAYTTASTTVPLTVTQAIPTATLTLTSGGSPATSIPAGTVLTLTATVASAAGPITPGQVIFCDASAAFCTDIHLLGTAQLTSSGTATFRFVPGLGTHTYKAVFNGTKNVAAASSAASPITVTGKFPTSTQIAQSGAAGNYTLTATTVGLGNPTAGPTGTISFLNQSNNNAVLATAPLGSATAGLSFTGVSSSTGLGNPQTRSAIADFNGDGILDVATANSAPGQNQTVYANTVTISLGNGDGTFKTSGVGPSTGSLPEAIVAADFNGDGIVDLATTNYNDSTVTVLLGNGDGTFRTASTPATATGPLELVAADFNGDGVMDLAVSGAGGYTVLLGNGDGTFTLSQMKNTIGAFAAIVSADFNGDGIPDLATLQYSPSNELIIFLGNGDGIFTQGPSIPLPGAGSNLNGLASGDFNGDGKIDLAATNGANNTISILTGKGDGTFTAALAASAIGAKPSDVQVTDFNGDGKLDLAVINGNDSTAPETILLGNGDGTFTIPAISTGVYAYDAVSIGDFNGDGVPDLLTNDGGSTLYAALTQLTQTTTATATSVSPSGNGTVQIAASYPGDTLFAPSLSAPTSLTAFASTPVLTWTPTVATIVFGTPLGPQQLDASAADALGNPIPGVFTYTPAAGSVLTAGPQTLSVTFTPTSPQFTVAKTTTSITVTQATPTLAWATPAAIAYGIPLSATQLNATATGVTGAILPGAFTYTPPAGTILNPGTQTLTASFTPTDTLDYVSTSTSVKLLVTGVTLTSITPSSALLGDPAKTLTLTGAGFVASSIVQVNGTAIPTTLVNPTTLTAVVPASDFLKVGTLQITVTDPTIAPNNGQTSAALPLVVAPASASVTVSAPPTTQPGTQPAVTLTINNPYPTPLTALFTLDFTPSVTPPVDDPAIQFANGGTTFSFTVPANSTAVPPIVLQSGTIAGTITIPVVLTSGGANVTPASLQPVVIVIPAAAPVIKTATLTRSGNQLTVAIHGFSNTREVTTATYHFVGVAGAQIDTPDITAQVATLFSGYYTSATSDQYGSTFTYTQVFNLSNDASNIASVQITLTNSAGVSTVQTAQ